ncbi:polyphenol oxidase I, chloroplastic-like [Spinacia oleracea]|uniref:Polyphenol oxidase I, chloroplastic-like n=1 Tax=Spinacia oleracea TaxID=3562 RepID=A0A9R0JDF9_SPIOL|nr:polyphenol oxidase I, chloroplastic-like [Spinacia oleracea]XP_056683666.1 polyphenol oxidase I, chloroplastic-like [Spinacia oleracea]
MAAILLFFTIISIYPLNPKPLFSETSPPYISQNRYRTNGLTSIISCKVGGNDDSHSPKRTNSINDENSFMLNRRNILVGLGSLCGGTTTTFPSGSNTLFAAPVSIDFSSCDSTDDTAGHQCCPPTPRNIVDFKPDSNQVLRLRPAAHLVNDEYLDKYSKAINMMKNLPEDDPRNFFQQANIHCAFCEGGHYHQLGFPNLDFLVHHSWLFFPFHRCFLYFYERILGKLIDDPSFALPFWNWDHPDGMYMPSMYTNPSSSLYDPLRHHSHLPPTLIDLSYDGIDNNDDLTPKQLIASNLAIMHRQMVSNSKNPTSFFGQAYRAGDEQPKGSGTIEIMPHNTVHRWTGDPTQPNREDMGTLYAAARDPIFFAHHANVDRMWTIWKTLGGKRKDIQDPDWLNVSFLFYDENAQPVRIRIRDCLDNKKLGYVYQDVDIPWINQKPNNASKFRPSTTSRITFPTRLDSTIRTRVVRQQTSRTKKQKEDEEEVLTINVELLRVDMFIKFDVYINEEDDYPRKMSRLNTEYAGSFVSLPDSHRQRKTTKKTSFMLGLTDLLQDLGVDGDDSIMVVMVPIAGSESLILTDVKIEFIS